MRFELDVKVDVDNDGAEMVVVDGGMRGTTNPNFAWGELGVSPERPF